MELTNTKNKKLLIVLLWILSLALCPFFIFVSKSNSYIPFFIVFGFATFLAYKFSITKKATFIAFLVIFSIKFLSVFLNLDFQFISFKNNGQDISRSLLVLTNVIISLSWLIFTYISSVFSKMIFQNFFLHLLLASVLLFALNIIIMEASLTVDFWKIFEVNTLNINYPYVGMLALVSQLIFNKLFKEEGDYKLSLNSLLIILAVCGTMYVFL